MDDIKPIKTNNKSKMVGVIALVVIVIAAISFAAYFWKGQKGTTKTPPAKPSFSDLAKNVDQKSRIQLQKAEPGKIVEGFPAGLIVDAKAANISSAESISTDLAKKLIVASYMTAESLSNLEKLYTDFFTKNKWHVLMDKNIGNSLNLIATLSDATGSASINISKDTTSSNNIVKILFYKNR
jgi:hypothetical protein